MALNKTLWMGEGSSPEEVNTWISTPIQRMTRSENGSYFTWEYIFKVKARFTERPCSIYISAPNNNYQDYSSPTLIYLTGILV